MRSGQGGFTAIEVVIAIVILGILAATAIPRFADLRGDARQAAVDGMAGALGSASAVNLAVRRLSTANGIAVKDCVAVAGSLEGGLDADYEIVPAAIPSGSTATCTVRAVDEITISQEFVGHGID